MRGFVLIGFLFLVSRVTAQQQLVVFFKDKPSSGTVSLNYHSSAAERRAKFGLTFDVSDYPVDGNYLKQLEAQGFKILKTSRWLNAALVNGLAGQDLENLSFVAKVETVKARASKVASLHALPGGKEVFSDKNFVQHRVNTLHDAGYTGKDVQIAVFDGGFKGVDAIAGFEKLRTENRIRYTQNLVGTGNVYQYSNHGTQVLSVMTGYLPESFMGTAPNATFSLFVTEDVASETQVEEFNWVVAAEIADSLGIDIINSSLGYTEFDDPATNYTHASLDGHTAISSQGAIWAARKGILVVNSAGNSRTDSWGKIGAPADADSILTVGAITTDSLIAFFSSPGPTADGRIKPEICALGYRTALINDGGELVTGNGTSFSSPLIAGICASVWQALPDFTNQEIRQLMMSISHKFANPDTNFGYGIPDLGKALQIINVYKSELQFNVFPNPTINNLNVSTRKVTGLVTFELLNAVGQLLSKAEQEVTPYTTINLNNLLATAEQGGTYFLRISSPEGTEVKALVLN